jgi:hypothetical protein
MIGDHPMRSRDTTKEEHLFLERWVIWDLLRVCFDADYRIKRANASTLQWIGELMRKAETVSNEL